MTGLTSEFVPSAEVPLPAEGPAMDIVCYDCNHAPCTCAEEAMRATTKPPKPVMVELPTPPMPPPQEPGFRVAQTPIQKGQIVGIVRKDREGIVVLPAVYKVMTLRSRGRLELKPIAVTAKK